ncbi:poly-gamma-glutamate hydrolase family protein [Micromonospora sp. M12]
MLALRVRRPPGQRKQRPPHHQHELRRTLALALVTASRRTLSFHGFTGTVGVPETWIGGLDTRLRDRIQEALLRAGFNVTVAFSEIAGVDPLNICNKNARGAGVQLEMSRSQREAFFPGETTSRAVRDSGARTSAFHSYAAAILSAVAGPEPDISLRVALLDPPTVDLFSRTVSGGWVARGPTPAGRAATTQ